MSSTAVLTAGVSEAIGCRDIVVGGLCWRCGGFDRISGAGCRSPPILVCFMFRHLEPALLPPFWGASGTCQWTLPLRTKSRQGRIIIAPPDRPPGDRRQRAANQPRPVRTATARRCWLPSPPARPGYRRAVGSLVTDRWRDANQRRGGLVAAQDPAEAACQACRNRRLPVDVTEIAPQRSSVRW
jgi:hypothetical protein